MHSTPLVAGSAIAFSLVVVASGAGIVVNEVTGPCSPGFFSGNGRMPCYSCQAGTFTNHWASTTCNLADPNYYVPAVASSSQMSCEPGTYSTEGATICEPCPPGGPCVSNPSSRRASKRGRKTRPPVANSRLCSNGMKNCPKTVTGRWFGSTVIKDYECVDTLNDLESCGGCVNSDSANGEVSILGGRDCSAIPGVDAVRCVQGACRIGRCRRGYSISFDGSGCRPSYVDYY